MTTRKTTKKPMKKSITLNHILTSIIMFGIGVFLVVLSFAEGAKLWMAVQNIFFAIFGFGAYAVGFLLIYIAILIAMKKPVFFKLTVSIIIVLLISAIFFIFSPLELNGDGLYQNLSSLVQLGRSREGGGLCVAFIGWPLLAAAGRPVANIIIILLSIIFFMLLTSITPYDIIIFFKKFISFFAVSWKLPNIKDEDYYEDELPPESASSQKTRLPPPWNGKTAKVFKGNNIDIPLGSTTSCTPGTSKEIYQPDPNVIEDGLVRKAVCKEDGKEDGESTVDSFAISTEYINENDAFSQQNSPALEKLIERAVSHRIEKEMPFVSQIPVLAGYELPPLDIFMPQQKVSEVGAEDEMRTTADLLVTTLQSFGVQTKMLDISRGPTLTRYELQPLTGVKISKITALADDIALNLASAGVRIEAPIPNKAAVGIEVPNKIVTAVGIRSILESREFQNSNSPLTIALGMDIAGQVQVADLTKMPHLLIAGSTGSGKSVCINSCIISFLCKSTPDRLRLILIDPKVVELADYNGIPHLLMPVVTEPRKAAGALGAAVAEMERRYHLFAEYNVREIKSFNTMAHRSGELEALPYIAIIIDELADLMMVSGKEVEDYICRIAQKARAAGMHLIVATQRPSVDVITGLIKANIPSRIAFAVSSGIDSRTILDGVGAEKLLGSGDMLFMPVGSGKPLRIQGNYVKDSEISSVLSFVRKQKSAEYDEQLIESAEKIAAAEPVKGGKASAVDNSGEGSNVDIMFWDAAEVVVDAGMASTSLLQRRLKLGYARAARIMDEMENADIIGPYEGSKPRSVILTRQQLQERKINS